LERLATFFTAAVIEDLAAIKKILKHLDLRAVKRRPLP
jgi:hypothetical protein